MIKARIDYATKSSKHPRFSRELDFNDEKHLENFIAKANREGKKIIGHEIVSNPCVYFVSTKHIGKMTTDLPSLNFAKEYGIKFTIEEFQKAFNEGSVVDQDNGYIIFDNIK